MGLGVPIPAKSQQLGGSVTAWCCILVDSGRSLAKVSRGLGLKYVKISFDLYIYFCFAINLFASGTLYFFRTPVRDYFQ